ncbi:MAG: glycoside hydrolase family 32 protein [Prolixibacteraceae bacterium]|nr:glycoside hydrolase family 32 protein [Prolixibacteraceae bacterium]
MKRFFFSGLGICMFFISGAQNQPSDLNINQKDMESARKIRYIELNDPFRPCWHLTIAEGNAMPFDPNGAIFKDGVYHLWHIYQAGNDLHFWQHLSSIDLFHWRWHSNPLQPQPGDPEKGIFSGNAFLDNDGKVVIAYHGYQAGGNCVAYSQDKDLNEWTKPKSNPIVNPGWDPHMWVEGNTYYQISGGMPGSTYPNPPVLYTSDSYDKPMTKVGNFMTHDMPGVDGFEDISCADFFKLEDKWVLLCISHSRGARYYVGAWDGKQFHPESHHRMNWPGGTFFAPETLIDDQGRRILWAWILDRKSGSSSGTMSMPRVLTLAKDKLSLSIKPAEEIERLRYNAMAEKPFSVAPGQSVTLPNVDGNVLEMEMLIDPGKAKRFGAKVFCSKDGREQTPIIIDRDKGELQIDMRQSSLDKPDYLEFAMFFGFPKDAKNPAVETQNAPFVVNPGEKVHLRIFLDKSILEVFANGRQCITQVIYPTLKDATSIQVFTDDSPVKVSGIKAWKLFPAMQW